MNYSQQQKLIRDYLQNMRENPKDPNKPSDQWEYLIAELEEDIDNMENTENLFGPSRDSALAKYTEIMKIVRSIDHKLNIDNEAKFQFFVLFGVYNQQEFEHELYHYLFD